MNDSRLLYSVPVADGREWQRYDSRRNRWVNTRTPGHSQAVGYVYRAQEGLSVPLWIHSEDPDLIPQLVSFEIERLTGRNIEPDDPALIIRKVARNNQHLLVHATLIGDELDEGMKLSRSWKRFLVSPILYQNENNEIQLWKEDSRWVAGFYLSGILVHWHAFGKGNLSALHIADLRCILDDLKMRDICNQPTGLRVHGDSLADSLLSEQIEETLGIPILQDGDTKAPFPALSADKKPNCLIAYQQRQRQLQMRLLLSCLVVMLIAAGVFVAWFDLQRQEREVAAIEQRVQTLEPRAEAVRQNRAKWDAMAPALKPENYPIEVFHRVAKLLPPKGVRLTEFSIRAGKITVRGEASSVPTAIKFKADLERSPELSHIQWEVPPPQISGDTAKFVAFGITEQPSTVVAQSE